MAGSTGKGFPYPSTGDPVNVSGDIQSLAAALDSYLTTRVLPAQTGNSGKVLSTDGTTQFWSTIVDDTKQQTEVAIIMGAY